MGLGSESVAGGGVGSPAHGPLAVLLLLAVGTCDFLAKRSLWTRNVLSMWLDRPKVVELKHLEAVLCQYKCIW